MNAATLLELVNGNMSLEAVIAEYPDHDIIENYDNQSVTKLVISMASTKPQLIEPIRHRAELLRSIQGRTNVFTVWSSRDHLQLADWLSKNEKAQFVEGLAARGLPPPKAEPFPRPQPRF